jgi:hypothetical protein
LLSCSTASLSAVLPLSTIIISTITREPAQGLLLDNDIAMSGDQFKVIDVIDFLKVNLKGKKSNFGRLGILIADQLFLCLLIIDIL